MVPSRRRSCLANVMPSVSLGMVLLEEGAVKSDFKACVLQPARSDPSLTCPHAPLPPCSELEGIRERIKEMRAEREHAQHAPSAVVVRCRAGSCSPGSVVTHALRGSSQGTVDGNTGAHIVAPTYSNGPRFSGVSSKVSASASASSEASAGAHAHAHAEAKEGGGGAQWWANPPPWWLPPPP